MKIIDDGITKRYEWDKDDDGPEADIPLAPDDDGPEADIPLAPDDDGPEADYDYGEMLRGHVEWLLAKTVSPEDEPAADRVRTLAADLDGFLAGPHADAFLCGVAFGEALEELRVRLDSTAVRTGRRVKRGGTFGTRLAHGTPEEHQARRAAWQRAFDHALSVGLSRLEAYDVVATEFRVSSRTIRRYVK